jgi:hypothetical protein
MGLQTYQIEIKLDAPDEHHAAMTQIIKQYARDLLSSAMLLSPGKMPQVVCRAEDAFYSTEEIEILDPSDNT